MRYFVLMVGREDGSVGLLLGELDIGRRHPFLFMPCMAQVCLGRLYII